MRRASQILLAVAVALAVLSPRVAAQLIPWHEPPMASGPVVEFVRWPAVSPALPPAPVAARKKEAGETIAKLPAAAPAEVAAMTALSGSPSSVAVASFGGDTGSGAVLAGTSWVGNVTQNAGSITVGGSARDDNGWGARRLSLDATGMNFIAITAQRETGNQAASLFLQFEDRDLRTQVFSVSTSEFAVGVPTTVHIPIGTWTVNFGSAAIASWSIGGGGVGSGVGAEAFRLTIDELSFTASAIPEPATYATVCAIIALGCALRRRGRRR